MSSMGNKIPKRQIDFIVDRFHVGTPNRDIEADIRGRADRSPDWTPATTTAAVKYALKRHGDNIELYCRVMGGHVR